MKSTRESAGYAATLMTKHAKTRLAGNSPMATSSRSITMTTSTWTSRLTCCPISGDISSFICAPMTTCRRPSLRTAWISTPWPSRASEAGTHRIPPSNTNCWSRSRMESRVRSACYNGNGSGVYINFITHFTVAFSLSTSPKKNRRGNFLILDMDF